MTWIPKKIELTDGDNTVDIDSDGNVSVSIRSGTNEVSVATCDESGNKSLAVHQEFPGDQKWHDESETEIGNGTSKTAECTPVPSGKTGYLEQIILAAQGGPTRAIVKQDNDTIGIFQLGGHVTTSQTTGHIGGSIVWPCDFSGLFKIVGDNSKKWTVDFKNECGVEMDVVAHATFIWREVTT